ncbi:hypothetical protein JW898_04715 [Candidatus Woesearchaeota archaeon]|nr:hypothetical protein [Candidatus Woesearchaeota archaeon]
MESLEELKDSARKSLKVAERVLIQTYPFVNDPRLVLAVAGDIYSALMSSIRALLLAGEKGLKNSLPDDFGSLFSSFKDVAGVYGFTEEDLSLVSDTCRILLAHKESPVEFARRDSMVICDSRYECSRISVDDMKKYLFRARLFVEKSESVLRDMEKRA